MSICTTLYTLAENIERKQMTAVENHIISETRCKVPEAKGTVDDVELRNDDKLMRLLESMYGDAAKVRELSVADHKAVAGPFEKNNDTTFVDPLDCEKMQNVCMSLANVTTTISV